jgi:hypothetical protein
MDNDLFPSSAQVTDTPGRLLRRFARQKVTLPAAVETSAERCDLCATPLPGEHRHLLDLQSQSMLCACQACALLFERPDHPKYRLLPTRYLALPDVVLSDQQWDELLIPVNMAFFLASSQEQRVRAFYPGPAGATEALLGIEHWHELLASNPSLGLLSPDVEALLVNRLEQARACYIVPLDCCYRLVGMIRKTWRGLSGGAEVWQSIHAFFAELQKRTRVLNAEEQRLVEELTRHQGGCYA